MKTVARRSTVQPLPVVAEDGTRPVVVALPDDELREVVSRVDAFGGRANVFVAFPDSLALIELMSGTGAQEGPDDQPVSDATSMAMYVEFLKLHDAPVSIRLSSAAQATVQHELQQVAYAF